MPYASTTVRDRVRAQLRARDGDAPCALMLTEDCRAAGGVIDYRAKAPHPRSFTADHIVATEQGGDDSLDNAQIACWACNNWKRNGVRADSSRSFRTHRSSL